MKIRFLLSAAALLLIGCGPSIQPEAAGPGATLAAEPATAAPGGEVELVLTNNGAEAIGYNLCSSGMERRAGGSWQPVQVDRMCTMELRMLEVGQSVRYPIEIPPAAEAGEYRFVTRVTGAASDTAGTLSTGPIRVGG